MSFRKKHTTAKTKSSETLVCRPNFEAIPVELKNERRWIVNQKGKSARSGWNDPTTWQTFAEIEPELSEDRRPGFVFGGGFVGFDWDNVRQANGQFPEDILQIVRKLKSYAEVSKSGRGLHIIARSDNAEALRSITKTSKAFATAGFEFYPRNRQFVLTGDVVEGLGEVRNATDAVEKIVAVHFPAGQAVSQQWRHFSYYRPELEAEVVQRHAAKYLETYPPAIQGKGGSNQMMRACAALAWGFGLEDFEALPILEAYNDTCLPPFDVDTETGPDSLPRKLREAYVERSRFHEPGRLLQPIPAAEGVWPLHSIWSAVRSPKPMDPEIIEGLSRRGEVINLTGGTKSRKSWLAMQMAFAVASGTPWLGRKTLKGRVLLIDNELKRSTIENRAAAIARANGLEFGAGPPFDYWELRGIGATIDDVIRRLEKLFAPGELTLIIMDAKYRFFGGGYAENSNDDQIRFHNAVDILANRMNATIALVHHFSKGDQSGKSNTDLGAGGGSQSRAADTLLSIRPHAQAENMAVLEATLRSLPPVEPQSIQWIHPLWSVAEGVEPVLKAPQTKNDSRQQRATHGRMESIIRMLELEPGHTLSENKLSGGHPDRPSYREAIEALKAEGRIEWDETYRPPRTPSGITVVGGWRMATADSDDSDDGGEE